MYSLSVQRVQSFDPCAVDAEVPPAKPRRRPHVHERGVLFCGKVEVVDEAEHAASAEGMHAGGGARLYGTAGKLQHGVCQGFGDDAGYVADERGDGAPFRGATSDAGDALRA